MSHSRIFSTLAAAASCLVLLGACSTESLTERAVGFGLEQAIEGNEDIDLDLSGDGGFTIKTDDGEFSLDLDQDGGGLTFDSTEGSGAISFDEDGIVFDSTEGSGTISVDEDGIVFDTDTDLGDGVVSFDEDGIVLDTDAGDAIIELDGGGLAYTNSDGSSMILGDNKVPDSWPDEVGVPTTADPEAIFFNIFEEGGEVAMTAQFQHDAAESYGVHVEEALASLGWELTESSEDEYGRYAQFNHDASRATVFADATGFTTVSITIA